MSIIRLGDHRIFAKGTEAQFLKGKEIIEKGKISHRIYLLKKGSLLIQDATGREIHFSKPQSLFGWESCFFDEPNSYTVKTETNCHFIVLTKKELDEIFLARSDEIKRLSFYSFQTNLDLFQKFNNINLGPQSSSARDFNEDDSYHQLLHMFINNFITHQQSDKLLTQQIHRALVILGTFIDAKRILYCQFDMQNNEMKVTQGWSDAETDNFWQGKVISEKEMPHIFSRLKSQNDVVIANTKKDLAEEKTDRDAVENMGISSMLAFPLAHEKQTNSVMLLMFEKPTQGWDHEKVSTLKMLHAILHHEIARIETDLQIADLNRKDLVSGLPNKKGFCEKLKTILNLSKRSKKKIGIFYIKFDHIKKVAKENRIIVQNIVHELTEKFQIICRKGDIIGHLHDDIFVIALAGLNHKNDARIIANRLVDLLETPIDIIGKPHYIASSTGISIYPDHGKSSLELLDLAEEAMYHAEDMSGTAYCFSEKSKFTESRNFEKIEEEIKKAYNTDNILTYFQPIYDLESKSIVSAEVLSRWRKEDDSIALPAEFLSICEKSGLIVHLSEKILKDTCQNVQKWHENGFDISASINVSMRWLIDDNFIQTIQDTIDTTHVDPSKISIELTEGILLRDIDRAQEILGSLKEIGVGLCLDDFGTGYSSLSFLHQLPIDTIKIDKSFVHNISEDENTPKLIKGLLKLANELNFKVIAEGIETKQQEKFLKQIKCPYGQGFLYSRAIPELDFFDLLALNKAK